jgi:hypothetical protein
LAFRPSAQGPLGVKDQVDPVHHLAVNKTAERKSRT